MGSYIAVKKPGLSAENIRKRLDWAIKYKDWTIEDWKKVIWSDECSVWIGVNPRRQWVIHPPGERLDRKYVNKTFKSAQVKVMVWAYFTGDRLGPLVVCDEGGLARMNTKTFYTTDCSPLLTTFYNHRNPIQYKSPMRIPSSLCKTMPNATRRSAFSNSFKKIMSL